MALTHIPGDTRQYICIPQTSLSNLNKLTTISSFYKCSSLKSSFWLHTQSNGFAESKKKVSKIFAKSCML